MADTQSGKKQNGLTRRKAVIIGVLGVVLVAVMYIQYGSSGAESATDAAAFAPRRQPAARPGQAQTAPTETVDPEAQVRNELALPAIVDPALWKAPPMETVIAHDPFALPVTFPRPVKVAIDPNMNASSEDAVAAAASEAEKLANEVERIKQQLEELTQRGVHVIVRDQRKRDQYAAMIGDRMIHVGDEINGFVVTDIQPDGVQVEEKVSQ